MDNIGKSTSNGVKASKATGTDYEVGSTLQNEHIQIYGWIDPGGNVTSAKTGYDSNFPAAYMYTPNIVPDRPGDIIWHF